MSLESALKTARTLIDQLISDSDFYDFFDQLLKASVNSYQNEGKLLCCGNGGSACDAAHFCEELVGRFRENRAALPAMALNEAGVLTCVANDFGYQQVFSRQVEAFAKQPDLLILLSTSGNSQNLLEAAKIAKQKGVKVIALLGKDGGVLKQYLDNCYIFPGETSDRIQELHMLVLHYLVEEIEKNLFN